MGKEPINISDSQSLITIFDTMADYYAHGEGRIKEKRADFLYIIYDSLSEVFGRKSDYDKSNQEL